VDLYEASGIKTPYLLKIHGYPLSSLSPLYFWNERMERKRGGIRREGGRREST